MRRPAFHADSHAHRSRTSRAPGFTLIEMLVALAVFATMAALAWGGLNSIARARGELARQQADFQRLVRALDALDRDLRAAVARPIFGNTGEVLPALIGNGERIEFTRLGFANPQAERRSNLERTAYALDNGTLVRGTWAVLDRAPTTPAQTHPLREHIDRWRVRYLDDGLHWLDAWPPLNADPATLPRAVELTLAVPDYGEITHTVELPRLPGGEPGAGGW